MKENKIVKQAGAWYEYVDTETGEIFKFQSKDFIPLMGEKEELREQIYKRICGDQLSYNINQILLISMLIQLILKHLVKMTKSYE